MRRALTAENTAIVLDSTADFPDAHDRFPTWRVFPLYVNFGTESFRDGVDLTAAEFYERLRTAPELPTTSQPTPADFLAAYEELGAYERVLSVHIAAKLSGTFQSAGTAAAQLGDGRVRTIDSQSASVAISVLALALPRRRDRPREGVRGQAHELEADPGDPRRRGSAGQARPREPQGVPGVRRRARHADARRTESSCRHRARRCGRADDRAREDGARQAATGADRDGDDARRRDRRALRA